MGGARGTVRPYGRLVRALALGTFAAGALASSGCATVHRPPATVASLTAYGDTARTQERATVDSVVARLARRAAVRGDRTLDVLLLSGGGQHGAYGAGFLRGWRSRADAPMPTFDLVTGVSTGALQAPFALLGTPAALDTLSAIYLRAASQIAPTIDWLFWLRRTGGLVKTRRFERTIARVFDDTLGARLGEAFDGGRQLVIATTDFDLAVGRTWDLGREMRAPAGGLARAHALLRASTAIPGIFPPVVLDGHVQVDGGVISNVAAVLDLDDYRARRTPPRGRRRDGGRAGDGAAVGRDEPLDAPGGSSDGAREPARHPAPVQHGALLGAAAAAPRPARDARPRRERRRAGAPPNASLHRGAVGAFAGARRGQAVRRGVDAAARRVRLRAGTRCHTVGRDPVSVRAAACFTLTICR